MAVLTDRDILRRLGEGPLVDPFVEANLTPNGVDLRVAEVMFEDRKVEEDHFDLPPGKRALLSTVEVVTLPDDLVGNLWLRSSLIRKGLISSFGVVDAGFSGTLTVAAFNAGHMPVRIARGDRFCQIVFLDMTEKVERPYAQRSGSYQDQRGITLAGK